MSDLKNVQPLADFNWDEFENGSSANVSKQELEKAIAEAPFQTPVCPVYQNVDAKPYTDPAAIKANLIAQLTAPVRWTYIVRNMLSDGVTEFTELGPGSVLQGLIRKVDPNAVVESKSTL